MDESEVKKNKNFYFIKIKLDQILEYCLTWMLDRTWTLSFRKDRTECVIFDGAKKSEIGVSTPQRNAIKGLAWYRDVQKKGKNGRSKNSTESTYIYVYRKFIAPSQHPR